MHLKYTCLNKVAVARRPLAYHSGARTVPGRGTPRSRKDTRFAQIELTVGTSRAYATYLWPQAASQGATRLQTARQKIRSKIRSKENQAPAAERLGFC
jgi:hypothetical protein